MRRRKRQTMRVDVTRWIRTETGKGYISFRAGAAEIYLTREEVSRYNLQAETEPFRMDLFRLIVDVRELSVGRAGPLAEQIHAEWRRQETVKDQTEGNLPPPEQNVSFRDINQR